MRATPAMMELIAELHRLGAADQRAILARLEPAERQRIEVQLDKLVRRPEPSFDALACLSPWLSESLAEARTGSDGKLTPATREVLMEAERLLPSAKPTGSATPSLFGRFMARVRKG